MPIDSPQKSKQLIIVGASGYGLDLADIASAVCGSGDEFEKIAGFLDNRLDLVEQGLPYPWLGTVEGYLPKPNDVFILGIGDPKIRRQYAEVLDEKKVCWARVIHPQASYSPFADIAEGCFLGPFSCVGAKSTLGPHTHVNAHAVIGHDVTVEAFGQISSFSFLGGYSTLEACVTLNPHTTITRTVRVGEGATVGAGSVVLQSVKANQTVFGVPALPMKTVV
jgi:sugar O-acyltransferase (sialic acid O-acetyltransferase NeuD family)